MNKFVLSWYSLKPVTYTKNWREIILKFNGYLSEKTRQFNKFNLPVTCMDLAS